MASNDIKARINLRGTLDMKRRYSEHYRHFQERNYVGRLANYLSPLARVPCEGRHAIYLIYQIINLYMPSNYADRYIALPLFQKVRELHANLFVPR